MLQTRAGQGSWMDKSLYVIEAQGYDILGWRDGSNIKG